MRRALSAIRAGVCLLLLALGTGLAESAQAQPAGLEYAVKASYLFRFGSFVSWPETAFTTPTSSVTLCVIGTDPLGAVLDRALAGQKIGIRPVVAKRLASFDPAAGCHIVYAAGSPAQSVADIVRAAQGQPVLTVTDAARDPLANGIVHFVIVANRVRFLIDDEQAAHGSLSISSRLLSLAVTVKKRVTP